MSYITYFDLLGTKGFCEDSETYFNNITAFYDTVYKSSHLLKGVGKVGIFSDCAYGQATDVLYLLDFLVTVRQRLMAKGLYFNAVVKKGELGIEFPHDSDECPAYGIAFKSSTIASLYISQMNFKGIGIYVDPSIISEIKLDNKEYRFSDCIYIDRSMKNYQPVAYKDLTLTQPLYKGGINNSISMLLKALYSAYIKSPRYGVYYISMLSNMLRSTTQPIKWEMTKSDILDQSIPKIYKVIVKLLRQKDKLANLEGLEDLALILLDQAYTSLEREEYKRDITRRIIEIDCVKERFANELNNIPNGLFTLNPKTGEDNKKLFISFCQTDLTYGFIDPIMADL